MTDSNMKHFYINPATNAPAIRVWNKWKTSGVNISDRLCKLMVKSDEEEEQTKLAIQNHNSESLNDAFLQTEEDKRENPFKDLPPRHQRLTKAHIDKLGLESIIELLRTNHEDYQVIKQVVQYHETIDPSTYRQVTKIVVVDPRRKGEWDTIQEEQRRKRFFEGHRKSLRREEEERQDKSKSMILASDISETSDQKIKS